MYGNNNNNNNQQSFGSYGNYTQASPYSGYDQQQQASSSSSYDYSQQQQQQPQQYGYDQGSSQQQYGYYDSSQQNSNYDDGNYDGSTYDSSNQSSGNVQNSWQQQQQQQQGQSYSHVQVPAGASQNDEEWFSTAASSGAMGGSDQNNAVNMGQGSGYGGFTSTGFNAPSTTSSGHTSKGFGAPSHPSQQQSQGNSGSGTQGSVPKYTSVGFGAPPPPETSMGSRMDSSGPVNYDDEPPLLEELGINFDHIRTKTIAVLVPTKTIEPEILADTDMAGPLVFCLIQGFCLMLSGKLFFGYVFGFGVMGCLFIYLVINLMNHAGTTAIDIYRVCSVLGYCLLPIVLLSAVTILFDLSQASIIGTPLTLIAILWCTQTATRFFEAATQMLEQRYLIAYPVFLLYACFALITVF